MGGALRERPVRASAAKVPLEIRGDAALFPVAVTDGIGATPAADFGGGPLGGGFFGLAPPSLSLRQRAASSRGQPAVVLSGLIGVGFRMHGPGRVWLLPRELSI